MVIPCRLTWTKWSSTSSTLQRAYFPKNTLVVPRFARDDLQVKVIALLWLYHVGWPERSEAQQAQQVQHCNVLIFRRIHLSCLASLVTIYRLGDYVIMVISCRLTWTKWSSTKSKSSTLQYAYFPKNTLVVPRFARDDLQVRWLRYYGYTM